MARVSYLDREQLPEDKRWLYDNLNKGTGSNIFRAMAHNPRVMRGVMVLGTALLEKSKLQRRLQEMVILRVGQMTRCQYELAHHLIMSQRAGVKPEEIAALPNWRESDLFGPQEKVVLEYTETLTNQIDIPDELFAKARQFFDEQEIIELTITAGYYNMLARYLVPMRIDLEPGLKTTL